MTEYFKKTGVPTTRNKNCLFQETEFFYSYYLQDYNLFILEGGAFFFLSEYQSDHTQDAPQQRAPDAHLGCWGVLSEFCFLKWTVIKLHQAREDTMSPFHICKECRGYPAPQCPRARARPLTQLFTNMVLSSLLSSGSPFGSQSTLKDFCFLSSSKPLNL